MIRKTDVIARNVAGEEVLVPIRGELADMQHIFTVNSVGACIWERLTEEQTEEQLVAALLERFEVTPESAATDVREFVAQLRAADLLQPESSA